MSEFPGSPRPQGAPSSAGPVGGPQPGGAASAASGAQSAVPASVRGAVDLGAQGAGRGERGAAASSTGAGTSYRVVLTTGNFQQYAEASTS